MSSNALNEISGGAIGLGVGALGVSLIPTAIAGIALLAASPMIGVAAIAWIALTILGASANIVAIGVAIPLILAAPELIVAAISILGTVIIGGAGLVSSGLGLCGFAFSAIST